MMDGILAEMAIGAKKKGSTFNQHIPPSANDVLKVTVDMNMRVHKEFLWADE